MVGVIFNQAIVYLLLFQQRGVAIFGRLMRLVCVRMVYDGYKAADAGIVAIESGGKMLAELRLRGGLHMQRKLLPMCAKEE